MAEAFAKMNLRNNVLSKDIDRAMAVSLKSFVSTQKQGYRRDLLKVNV